MLSKVTKVQQREHFITPDTLEQLEIRNQALETRIRELESELRLQRDIIQNGIGDMVDTLAHKWRQPLNNIGLIVQGLQLAFNANDLSSEEMNADVSEIMNELYLISKTITDLKTSFSLEPKDKIL